MNKQPIKKLNRRDAIKLLGAVTGAAILANLPTKWKTPEIANGVLPAHAQTSGLTILSCSQINQIPSCPSVDNVSLIFSVQLSANIPDIMMNYLITKVGTPFSPFDPMIGTVLSSGGIAQVAVNTGTGNTNPLTTVTAEWGIPKTGISCQTSVTINLCG